MNTLDPIYELSFNALYLIDTASTTWNQSMTVFVIYLQL